MPRKILEKVHRDLIDSTLLMVISSEYKNKLKQSFRSIFCKYEFLLWKTM